MWIGIDWKILIHNPAHARIVQQRAPILLRYNGDAFGDR